jgi:hypothetical protein
VIAYRQQIAHGRLNTDRGARPDLKLVTEDASSYVG